MEVGGRRARGQALPRRLRVGSRGVVDTADCASEEGCRPAAVRQEVQEEERRVIWRAVGPER